LLTSDLVRVRRRQGALTPAYLSGDAPTRVLPVARAIVATIVGLVGAARGEVDEALDAIPVSARDRVVALGLRKLCEDRCVFEVADGDAPEVYRREVFRAAAAAHRALDVGATFDRDAVLAEVAGRLGATPEVIDRDLYGDLRESEVLRSFDAPSPEALVEVYNVALAQAVLLRATKVVVRVEGEPAARYRDIFRAIRFHGLLHAVEGDPDRGYTIVLDGPFSLFGAVQKYGLKLALCLPPILACRTFHVRAEVLWGKAKEPGVLEIGPRDALVPAAPDAPLLRPELEALCEAFERLGSAWSVAASERIFAPPGEPVVIPDLVFTSRETGEEVYLEAFGFWSRAAVWRRVEQLQRGLGARMILVVNKHLRVSEDVLGESDAGEIYVYRTAISPRAVLERLERTAAKPRKQRT
jgi:predicted nuclease of restriction endonuclease-like RecB superfamily